MPSNLAWMHNNFRPRAIHSSIRSTLICHWEVRVEASLLLTSPDRVRLVWWLTRGNTRMKVIPTKPSKGELLTDSITETCSDISNSFGFVGWTPAERPAVPSWQPYWFRHEDPKALLLDETEVYDEWPFVLSVLRSKDPELLSFSLDESKDEYVSTEQAI